MKILYSANDMERLETILIADMKQPNVMYSRLIVESLLNFSQWLECRSDVKILTNGFNTDIELGLFCF